MSSATATATGSSRGGARARTRTPAQAQSSSYDDADDKLDLGLDFTRMNFATVVARTQEAIQHDTRRRDGRDTTAASEQDALLMRAMTQSSTRDDAHDDDCRDAEHSERHRDRPHRTTTATAMHYTHTDELRDCALTGSWAKAQRLFDDELRRACVYVRRLSHILNVSDDTAAATTATTTTTTSEEMGDEAACLAAMQRILAAQSPLPLTSDGSDMSSNKDAQDDASDTTTSATQASSDNNNSSNDGTMSSPLRATVASDTAALQRASVALSSSCAAPTGLLQWRSLDCYLLLKTLVQGERVREVARVWGVLRGSGLARHRLTPRTINALLTLLLRRRRRRRAQQRGLHVSSDSHSGDADAHTVYGEMVQHLEALARASAVTVDERNERAARTARLSASLRQQHSDTQTTQQQQQQQGGDDTNDNSSSNSNDATLATGLRVGDFNTLLRRARGERDVRRIVQLMRSTGVEMNGGSYAALLIALHSPAYAFDDDDDNSSNSNNTSSSSEATREVYEAHKERRIARARVWFAACPPAQRTASVYNALLYLLRGAPHAAEFDAVLAQWRGNALRPAEVHAAQWRAVMAARRQAKATASTTVDTHDTNTASNKEEKAAAGAAAAAAPMTSTTTTLLPPQWTVPPNSKTYELLIQRMRYLHDWPAMWALYEEMRNVVVPDTRSRAAAATAATATRVAHDGQGEHDNNNINNNNNNNDDNDSDDDTSANAMTTQLRAPRSVRLRGTARLYEMLLSEAVAHPPPPSPQSSSSSSGEAAHGTRTTRDTSALVLQLYADMRDSRLDVTTPASTVNVLNAWSNTRTRRRWS